MKLATVEEKILFRERGYIVIKNAFEYEQLIDFQKALENITSVFFERYVQQDNMTNRRSLLNCDEKIIALKNINPKYISIIQRIVSRSPEFFSFSSFTASMKFIRSLYELNETSPVYIVNNGVVFTCPNDQNNQYVSNFEIDWHNDVFYTIPCSKFWQVWVPLLHDATKDIGTLVVCPGSHNDGIGKQRINIDADYNHRYTIDPDSLSRYNPESIELQLGDALIFDSRLIHKSGANTSNNVRCTMLGSYHDATRQEFSPLGFEYKYYGETPEGYFHRLFGDENAKKIMFDDAAALDLPLRNGV